MQPGATKDRAMKVKPRTSKLGAAGHDEVSQGRKLDDGRVDLHFQTRNHRFVQRRQ